MQDTKFQEDIEVQKSIGHFVVPKGVRQVRSFRIVLASCILVEIVKPIFFQVFVLVSLSGSNPSQEENIRKTSMRRHPFEKAKPDLQKFLRGGRFQTFVLQIL